ISAKAVHAPAANGWVYAPEPDVELLAGRFYLLGAHWNQSCGYQYRPSALPLPVSFGHAVEGKAFSGMAPAIFDNSPGGTTTAYPQQVRIVEPGALRMDSSVNNSLSINHADIQVDLSHLASATLRFTHRAFGEEAH